MAFRYTRVEKQIRRQLTAELGASTSEAHRGQIRKQLDDIATAARKRAKEKQRAREHTENPVPQRDQFASDDAWLLAVEEYTANRLLQRSNASLRSVRAASATLKKARKRKAAMGIRQLQTPQPHQAPRTPQTAVATTDFAQLTNAEVVAQFYKEKYLPALIGGPPDAERIHLVELEIESRRIPLVRWTGSRFVDTRTGEKFLDLSQPHLRLPD